MSGEAVAAVVANARARVEAELGAPQHISVVQAKRDAPDLAGRIDHTILAANATRAEVERVCAEARDHHFASVCVNSRWVPLVAATLAGSDVMTCSVIGFPLGAMAAEAKAEEARLAIAAGADELDMVLDIGGLRSGDLEAVLDDITGVVTAAQGRPVKVIIETALLDDDQKAVACVLAARAGAAYVKTSTGFSTSGATEDDIRLMRAVVGDDLGVKASGGIRSRETALAMLAAGADRIGASASVAIATDSGSASGGY